MTEKNSSVETQKNNEKKYILLQNNNNNYISYDNEKAYKNDEEIPIDSPENKKKEAKSAEEEAKSTAEKLKKEILNNFLKKHYKHIVILTGAGTSMNNPTKKKEEENEEKGADGGKDRQGLWNACKENIDTICDKIETLNSKKLKEEDVYKKQNIESFLSYVIAFNKVFENIDITNSIKTIQETIVKECTLKLKDITNAPHKDFLNKITARKNNDPRVQLFTTNYDTLFEQAATKAGFVVIDGFSFTEPREFSGKWFDLDIVNRERTRLKQEESFISKVFHLYKLHGSLNWTKDENGRIFQKDNAENPLIIYPASEKYESSYEQPYFEMMSRFQQALRKEETLLIVIGFGFKDKHIQNAIIEAVEQNPSFQLLIVSYNVTESIDDTALKDFVLVENKKDNDGKDVKTMKVKRNVTIVFDTFKSFTDNYPENQAYNTEEKEDETI